MTTKATIVIKFGDDVANANSYHAIAELDGTMNRTLAGEEKTSFNPGDDVYFLVQHDSRVRVTAIRPTCGQVDSLGQVTRTRSNLLLFTAVNEKQSMGYMGSSASPLWYGNSASLSPSETLDFISTSGLFPAIGKITRSCPFNLYRLRTNIPALGVDETYPVAVVVYMEVI